jgi:hypothetical protein
VVRRVFYTIINSLLKKGVPVYLLITLSARPDITRNNNSVHGAIRRFLPHWALGAAPKQIAETKITWIVYCQIDSSHIVNIPLIDSTLRSFVRDNSLRDYNIIVEEDLETKILKAKGSILWEENE